MKGAFGEDSRHVGIFWLMKLGDLDEASSARAFSVTPGLPVTFQRFGPEAIDPLARVMGMTDHTPIARRFERGKRCYAALLGEQIVTYGWVTFDEESIGELSLKARLRAGEAYIWNCATLPAYRGQRLYPALLAHILGALAAEGISHVWLGTDADNIPSQKGVALVGFQPVLDVGFVHSSLGNSMWIRERPGASEQDARDAHRVLLGRL
ncbi:MAG TPA: GNAT family N-acetyltransferase [Ktedonobacteraceae bacterium]|nr:GNAT family N-acetyltransferase [Ktedonobacteraceae bacterium]